MRARIDQAAWSEEIARRHRRFDRIFDVAGILTWLTIAGIWSVIDYESLVNGSSGRPMATLIVVTSSVAFLVWVGGDRLARIAWLRRINNTFAANGWDVPTLRAEMRQDARARKEARRRRRHADGPDPRLFPPPY